MLSAVDLVKVSKRLSYVLRHRPDSVGLVLAEGGWVAIDELLAALARGGTRLSLEELETVVASNDKRRFTIEGGRIRANQGHSKMRQWQRHGKPIVLTVASGQMAGVGHDFFLSANGVWLTEHVPPAYLVLP